MSKDKINIEGDDMTPVALTTSGSPQAIDGDHLSQDTNSPASLDEFARWLRGLPDVDNDAISRRRLLALYAEFCEYFDLAPLSPGRFDRALKRAGFQRFRLSIPGRLWIYRVMRPGSALVLKSRSIEHV